MNDGESSESFLARQKRLKDEHRNGNGMGTPLAMAATLWDTPTTRDHKDVGDLSNVPENGLLGRQVSNWATPMAMDGVKPSAGNRRSDDLSHQAQQHATSGEKSSPSGQTSRRRLNPAFVTALMGWPDFWTEII